MSKKLFISVFLCFFVFSSGLFAQKKGEEPKTVRFLFRDDVISPYVFTAPDDKMCEENVFPSTPIIMGNVPPSSKAEAIFFEIWFNFWYEYYYYCPENHIKGGLILELINPDVIPSELQVICGGWYFDHRDQYGFTGPNWGWERGTISDKYGLFRDKVWFWKVMNKSNQQEVPEEEAIFIINKLIDKGFDIQFYFRGMLKGAPEIELCWLSLEVTCIK